MFPLINDSMVGKVKVSLNVAPSSRVVVMLETPDSLGKLELRIISYLLAS